MGPALDRVKAMLSSLPEEEQREVMNQLRRNLAPKPDRASRQLAALTSRAGKVWFLDEYVKCGKPACKCARGQLHGPYAYRYWREDGRLRKAYVGRKAKAA